MRWRDETLADIQTYTHAIYRDTHVNTRLLRRIMATLQDVRDALDALDTKIQNAADRDAAEDAADLQPLLDHITAQGNRIDSLDAAAPPAPAPSAPAPAEAPPADVPPPPDQITGTGSLG